MTVFDAFPNALETWTLYEKIENTEVGKTLGNSVELHVIVDEADEAHQNEAPDAPYIVADTLLYAKPSELPTLSPSALTGDYIASDGSTYYEILEAGLGKNQETGEIEHVELRVRATEVADVTE